MKDQLLSIMSRQPDIHIFCPATIGTLQLKSDAIDTVNPFTRFILWAIQHNFTVNDIAETICFNKNIINDELEHLEKEHLITSTCSLTDSGKDFCETMNLIEQFNKAAHKIIVNKYTGTFEEYTDDKLCECNDLRYSLPDIVQLNVMRQYNYGPTIDYFQKYFSKKYDIPNMFRDSITKFVRIEKEVSGYLRYVYSPTNEPDVGINTHLIQLNYDIFHFKYVAKNQLLDLYRNAENSLLMLKKLDSSLLSEHANSILSQFEEEDKINSLISDVSYNAFDNYTVPAVQLDHQTGTKLAEATAFFDINFIGVNLADNIRSCIPEHYCVEMISRDVKVANVLLSFRDFQRI